MMSSVKMRVFAPNAREVLNVFIRYAAEDESADTFDSEVKELTPVVEAAFLLAATRPD